MTKHKRIEKTVQVETCLGLEYSTLAELKGMVEAWIASHGEDAWLAQYQDPYGNDYYWAIDKKVPETDAEYDARVANLKKFEQSQEKRDRAEFERLSKKIWYCMSKVTQVNINEMIPGCGRYYRAHAFRFAIFALIALPVIISLLLIYLNPFWFRESFGRWICNAWTPVGRWIRYRAYTIYLGCDPKVWEALNKRNN